MAREGGENKMEGWDDDKTYVMNPKVTMKTRRVKKVKLSPYSSIHH